MTEGVEPNGVLFDPRAFDLPRPWVDGRCRVCSRKPTDLGHDPCIANLPHLLFACCGHGCETAYLVTDHGVCLYGLDALLLMRRLGGDPPS
jgi:hypothetical protein